MPSTKIRRARDGSLMGAAGEAVKCNELMAWFDAGCDKDAFPDSDSAASLLVIIQGRAMFYQGSWSPLPIEAPFFSIGSGQHLAIAAMHLGKDAREAVEIACIYDSACGLGVDVLEWGPQDAQAAPKAAAKRGRK